MYRAFVKAARTKDPRATMNALLEWLDRREGGMPTLSAFVEEHSSVPGLTASVRDLERAIYSSSPGAWSPTELGTAVRAVHKRRAPAARGVTPRGPILGPLNPGGTG